MAVIVCNRQRAVVFDLAAVTVFAQRAAESCSFDIVDIALVSDRRIAALHRRFLQIRGATDVITFAHGEIVVSAQVAARAAREHGETLEREICRYVLHGLLHLRGHEDATSGARATMWRVQERMLRRLWPPPTPSGKSTNLQKGDSRR